MHLSEMLLELSARLPELEWKLGQRAVIIRAKMLPRGLFRHVKVERNIDYVQEIRDDLAALSRQAGLERAEYLALKIQQKINVLVGICQMSKEVSLQVDQSRLSMRSMMTRQQWLSNLEAEIAHLKKQQIAMFKALEHLDKNNMTAQHEARIALAAIEKGLTIASEAFEQAAK